MPKLKTNRSAAKRFRFTKTGKVKRSQACKSHLLTKKAPKRKRQLRGSVVVHERNDNAMRALLPYGG